MSDSTPTPDAARTPESTPASTSKSAGESNLDAQSENGPVGTADSTPEPTLEFTSVEKALYELGFGYQTFRFWAEVCWFEVGGSPCNETKRHYWHVAEILEYLLAQDGLDAESKERLQRMQRANSLCWNVLRENLNLPERCQLAEMIQDSEPEFLTYDLWCQNTVLHRSEWKEYEASMTQSCVTLEEPLSVLIETGMIVAKAQLNGHGPPASRGEHFPITRLRDALLRLREHYPDLNGDDLDVSESRLDDVTTKYQLSLEQAIERSCETIHVVLLDGLSSDSTKTHPSTAETRRRKKKLPQRDDEKYL